jgi:hypothetical protein
MIHYSYIPSKPGYWRSINQTLMNRFSERGDIFFSSSNKKHYSGGFFYFNDSCFFIFFKIL